MSDFIKGELLILYVHDDSIYRPIACLTSNSLSQSRGIIEAQTKCDPGETIKSTGAMSYNLSCEGNYIDTTSVGSEVTKASHDFMKGYMDSGAEFTWKLDTGLTDNPAYYGNAVLTELEMTAPSGDEFTTFTATLEGSGQIVTTDPKA